MGLCSKKWAVKLVLAFFVLSLFQGVFLLHPSELDSATITLAKDQLSNSRLSYLTALEGAHSVGATTVTIDTTNYTDQNNFHIFPGDSVTIGSDSYTVSTIIDDASDDKFTITTGLLSGDTADDSTIYVNQASTHTISFTTTSAVADGSIRISVPANTNDANNSDSQPDIDGFDFDSMAGSDVTCPSDVSGYYDFLATGTATDAATSGWHTFECRYSGNGDTSTALTMTIGGTNKLINPAPDSTHTQGIADDYTIRIENRDSNYDVADTVDAKVVVIEAVRVSATVEETLSFTIASVGTGVTNCGANASTDATTTVYSVPFGSISSFNAFYDAEQQLSVSTNADDGYEVRMYEDDELGKDGADSPFIADTPCDTGPCTHASPQEWVTATQNGFGYSLQDSNGTDAEFEWDDTTPTTGFKANQFPNYTTGPTEYLDPSAKIMSYTGPVSGSSIFVCYRLTVSGIQEAGVYYNTVTYIATPKF